MTDTIETGVLETPEQAGVNRWQVMRPLSDEEYKLQIKEHSRYRARLFEDCPQSGWKTAELVPSTTDDYWFLRITSTGDVVFTQLAIPTSEIAEYLNDFGIADSAIIWRPQPCAPVDVNPFSEPPAKRQSSTDKVYFLQAENKGFIKIGFTNNPYSRIESIRAMSPVSLDVLVIITGGKPLEQKLHQRFSHLRHHGEWFHPEPELLEYINGLESEHE